MGRGPRYAAWVTALVSALALAVPEPGNPSTWAIVVRARSSAKGLDPYTATLLVSSGGEDAGATPNPVPARRSFRAATSWTRV